MIVSDELVYFELYNTGSELSRSIFLATAALGAKEFESSNSPDHIDNVILGDLSTKIKVGGIRNPWIWYFSMWRCGCAEKDSHFDPTQDFFIKDGECVNVDTLNSRAMSPAEHQLWKEVYADPTDPELFRRWLKRVFDKRRINGEASSFAGSAIAEFGGLLLYHYLRLYTLRFEEHSTAISSPEKVLSYDLEHNIIDQMIRAERIEDGVRRLYRTLDISEEDTDAALNATEGSTSESSCDDYHLYYDDECQALVADREAYLIKKYDYTF